MIAVPALPLDAHQPGGGEARQMPAGGLRRDAGDARELRRRERSARVLCRPCLDWSERRPHLAGAVGAALCARSLAEGWIRRIDGTRAVALTPKGERIFRERLGVRLD